MEFSSLHDLDGMPEYASALVEQVTVSWISLPTLSSPEWWTPVEVQPCRACRLPSPGAGKHGKTWENQGPFQGEETLLHLLPNEADEFMHRSEDPLVHVICTGLSQGISKGCRLRI